MDAPFTNWDRFLADIQYDFAGHTTSTDLPPDHGFPLRKDSDQWASLDFVMLGGADVEAASDQVVNYHPPVIYPLPARQLRIINLKLLELQAKVRELIPNLEHHPKTRKSLEELFRRVRYEHHLIEEYTHRFRSSPFLGMLHSSGAYTPEEIEKILAENNWDTEKSSFYLKSITNYNEITFRHREMLSTCTKIAKELHKAFGDNSKFSSLTSFNLSVTLVPVKDERQYQIRSILSLISDVGKFRESLERRNEWPPGAPLPVFSERNAFDLLKRLSVINFAAYPEIISKELKENIVSILKAMVGRPWLVLEQAAYQTWVLPLYRQLHLDIGPALAVRCICFLNPEQMADFIHAGGLNQDFTIVQIERILSNLERIPKLDHNLIKFLMSIYTRLTTEDPFVNLQEGAINAKYFSRSISNLGRIISAQHEGISELPRELHLLTQPLNLQFADGPDTDTLADFLSLCLSSPVLYRWAFSGQYTSTVLSKIFGNPACVIDLEKFELTKSTYIDLKNFVMGCENIDSPELLIFADFFRLPIDYEAELEEAIKNPEYLLKLVEQPQLLSSVLERNNYSYFLELITGIQRYFETIDERNFPKEEVAFLNLYNKVKNAYLLVNYPFQDARYQGMYVNTFAFEIFHLFPLLVRQIHTYIEDERLEAEEGSKILREIYQFFEQAKVPKNENFIRFSVLMNKYKAAIEMSKNHPLPQLLLDFENVLRDRLSADKSRLGGINLFLVEVSRREQTEIKEATCEIEAAIEVPDLGLEFQVDILRKFVMIVNADSTCISFFSTAIPNFVNFYKAGLTLMNKLRMHYRYNDIIPYKFLQALIDNQLGEADFEKALSPILEVLSDLHNYYKNASGMNLEFTERRYPSLGELRILSRFAVDKLTLPGNWFKSFYTAEEKSEIRRLFPKTKITGI